MEAMRYGENGMTPREVGAANLNPYEQAVQRRRAASRRRMGEPTSVEITEALERYLAGGGEIERLAAEPDHGRCLGREVRELSAGHAMVGGLRALPLDEVIVRDVSEGVGNGGDKCPRQPVYRGEGVT